MRWNSRCNIVLSVQNELLMIVSMSQSIWFPVSFAGSSCYYVVIGSPTLPMASDRFMWFPSLNGPHFLSTIFFPHFFFFFSLRWPFLWLSNKVKVAQMCLVHLWLHYLCKQVPRDVMSYPQLWKGAPSGDGPCRSATIHLFSMVLPISALAQTSTQDT